MVSNPSQNPSEKPVHLFIGTNKLTIYKGDIAHLDSDAVVCPVNRALDTNMGVAKAIIQAAGSSVKTFRPDFPEPFGKVVVLPGGRLKAKYIFMTVLLGEKGLDKMKMSISQAVERTIRYAEFLRLKTIAFPVLGSPDVQPPYEFIAKEMLENIVQYFKRRNTKIKAIFFSVFNNQAYDAFCKEAKSISNG